MDPACFPYGHIGSTALAGHSGGSGVEINHSCGGVALLHLSRVRQQGLKSCPAPVKMKRTCSTKPRRSRPTLVELSMRAGRFRGSCDDPQVESESGQGRALASYRRTVGGRVHIAVLMDSPAFSGKDRSHAHRSRLARGAQTTYDRVTFHFERSNSPGED